jgi:hypothetical protein
MPSNRAHINHDINKKRSRFTRELEETPPFLVDFDRNVEKYLGVKPKYNLITSPMSDDPEFLALPQVITIAGDDTTLL